MEDIVLKNTSLCAIVRDEKMNPAGGVVRFLRSVMPHVERGIVVDTGSLDGTRELLEEAQGQFPHLEIYDAEFRGYAEARNVSLSKVKTDWVFVLDADEVLTQKGYANLARKMEQLRYGGFDFECILVRPDGKLMSGGCHNPRLFKNRKENKYTNENGWKTEFLWCSEETMPGAVKMYHFVADTALCFEKFEQWYNGTNKGRLAPSTFPQFRSWKMLNPSRDRIRASKLDKPEESLEAEAIGISA